MERLFKPVPGTDARQMDFVPSKEPHECVARLPVPVCRGETWWIGRELRRPLCVAGDGCIKCCSRQRVYSSCFQKLETRLGARAEYCREQLSGKFSIRFRYCSFPLWRMARQMGEAFHEAWNGNNAKESGGKNDYIGRLKYRLNI